MRKVCSKCRELRDSKDFSCCKRDTDGSCVQYNSWCNSCRTKQNRERKNQQERLKPEISSDGKECLSCKKMKLFTEYSPSKRGRLGLSSYCKKCTKRLTKEVARKATAAYRARNPERWRSLHRLSMLKRRLRIETETDGTVSDEFLKFLYSQEICCWCNQQVPVEKRTAEHIVELSCGGIHSAHNMNMACVSCNSSRKNKNSNVMPVPGLFEKFIKEYDDNFSESS